MLTHLQAFSTAVQIADADWLLRAGILLGIVLVLSAGRLAAPRRITR